MTGFTTTALTMAGSAAASGIGSAISAKGAGDAADAQAAGARQNLHLYNQQKPINDQLLQQQQDQNNQLLQQSQGRNDQLLQQSQGRNDQLLQQSQGRNAKLLQHQQGRNDQLYRDATRYGRRKIQDGTNYGRNQLQNALLYGQHQLQPYNDLGRKGNAALGRYLGFTQYNVKPPEAPPKGAPAKDKAAYKTKLAQYNQDKAAHLKNQRGRSDFGDYFRPYTRADLMRDPVYQTELNENVRAWDQSAASRGSLMSGNTVAGLQDLTAAGIQRGYDRDWNQRQRKYGALTGLSAMGQNVAGQLTNLRTGIAAGQVANQHWGTNALLQNNQWGTAGRVDNNQWGAGHQVQNNQWGTGLRVNNNQWGAGLRVNNNQWGAGLRVNNNQWGAGHRVQNNQWATDGATGANTQAANAQANGAMSQANAWANGLDNVGYLAMRYGSGAFNGGTSGGYQYPASWNMGGY